MKTLILNGSPRKNGDVAFLVEQLVSKEKALEVKESIIYGHESR